jgi:O-antigen ligase
MTLNKHLILSADQACWFSHMTALNPGMTPPSLSRPAGLRESLTFLSQKPFALFMFLSLLLIGADLIAIKAVGLTMRIVFPLLIIAFAFLYKERGEKIYFNPTLTLLFLLLAMAGGISVIQSYDAVKSIGYTVWVLFDFFVIITLAYNFARQTEPYQLLSLWFLAYRVHVVLLILEIAYNLSRGAMVRPHVWFYESSYLAIFMTGYFGAALYMYLNVGRQYRLDCVISFFGLLATTSATGVFGMIFALALNILLAKERVRLLFAALIIASVIAGTLFLFFKDTPYYNLIVGFLFQENFSFDLILNRSGNRVIRALVGWQAFLHHPLTGIGIGGDAAYMDANPYPEQAWQYIHVWTDLETGQPFSNIIIEVLGTMGLIGFAPFAAILAFAIYSMSVAMRTARSASPVATAFFVGFFSIFLALQFESTFLRYYLWVPLGLAFGVMARAGSQGDAITDKQGNAAQNASLAKLASTANHLLPMQEG